jgi:hypothetical protein
MTTTAATEIINTETLSSGKSASPLTPQTAAASAAVTKPSLCKHWARSKICLYHAKGKCKFDHPADYEIPPPKQPSGRRRKQNQQTDLTHRHRSAGGRLQTRNDARVAILRAFLADTLAETSGITDLSSFNVLDVAGGKGELAFQLLNLNNVSSCYVIDPRPLSLGRFQKRLSRGFYHRSQGILQTDVVRPKSEPERPVAQLRCFFSSELWEKEQHDQQQQQQQQHNESAKESKDDREDDDEDEETIDETETVDSSNNNNYNDTNSSRKIGNYQKQRTKFFENCYKARGWVWPPVGNINEHAACGKNYDDRDDTYIPTSKAAATKTKNNTKNRPTTDAAKEANVKPGGAVGTNENDETENDGIGNEDLSNGGASSSIADIDTIAFDHASDVVKTADLIVGMHPDQAVDAIVDAALYQNISFFVVPCCTYSREFPNRRVRVPDLASSNKSEDAKDNDDDDNCNRRPKVTITMTTKLVTTYEELIDYLLAKSPDIKKHVLPFEGRNICLYRVVPPQEPGSIDSSSNSNALATTKS